MNSDKRGRDGIREASGLRPTGPENLAGRDETDPHKFLILSRLSAHRDTPFQQIAEQADTVLLVDYSDAVEGRLFYDAHAGYRLAVPDWGTQRRVKPDDDQPAVRGFRVRRGRKVLTPVAG